MTEQQIKGLIGALCNWMFGEGFWQLYTDEDDKGTLILIETYKYGKFCGSIDEVYCELEKLFFSSCSIIN